jgi:hypothetical protein
MRIKVENDRLIAYDRHDNSITIYLDIDAKELAKALKPYLDSIDNCECKKNDGLESVNI